MLIGRTLTVLSVVAVLISGSPSSAPDFEVTRATLKGLVGVVVVVEEFDEASKRAGFHRRAFQTDVELKLRMAGIEVLGREKMRDTPGKPYLYVSVITTHDEANEVAAFSIDVELFQETLLARDPSLPACGAATWSTSGAGQDDISAIREKVKDLTDEFVNAWLSVNPKE